ANDPRLTLRLLHAKPRVPIHQSRKRKSPAILIASWVGTSSCSSISSAKPLSSSHVSSAVAVIQRALSGRSSSSSRAVTCETSASPRTSTSALCATVAILARALSDKTRFSVGCAHFVPTARSRDAKRSSLERRKRCGCSASVEWAVLGSKQPASGRFLLFWDRTGTAPHCTYRTDGWFSPLARTAHQVRPRTGQVSERKWPSHARAGHR